MSGKSSESHECAPRGDVLHAISALQSLAEVFLRRREQLAATVGLSDSQWAVLEEISTEHFMPSLFARRRESSAAGVSRTIRQLTDKGLVSVSVSQEDARQRDYSLTEAGQLLMARLRAHREHAIAEVWTTFGTDELQRFNAFSQELITRLEAYSLTAEPTSLATEHEGEANHG